MQNSTHALHYGSSVFEGERAYNSKIYKSREHSVRLRKSAEYVDMDIPYTVDELEEAKRLVLDANQQKDAYVRAVAWRFWSRYGGCLRGTRSG